MRQVDIMPNLQSPKWRPISIFVRREYEVVRCSGQLSSQFEAFVYQNQKPTLNPWHHLLLPPPPFVCEPILDTVRHTWSRLGEECALPFHGKVEYVPELKLWFGISSKHCTLAAADLSAMASSQMTPLVVSAGMEFDPPEEWQRRGSRARAGDGVAGGDNGLHGGRVEATHGQMAQWAVAAWRAATAATCLAAVWRRGDRARQGAATAAGLTGEQRSSSHEMADGAIVGGDDLAGEAQPDSHGERRRGRDWRKFGAGMRQRQRQRRVRQRRGLKLNAATGAERDGCVRRRLFLRKQSAAHKHRGIRDSEAHTTAPPMPTRPHP
nr:unnamed protein product [Digitaria exilis]